MNTDMYRSKAAWNFLIPHMKYRGIPEFRQKNLLFPEILGNGGIQRQFRRKFGSTDVKNYGRILYRCNSVDSLILGRFDLFRVLWCKL